MLRHRSVGMWWLGIGNLDMTQPGKSAATWQWRARYAASAMAHAMTAQERYAPDCLCRSVVCQLSKEH